MYLCDIAGPSVTTSPASDIADFRVGMWNIEVSPQKQVNPARINSSWGPLLNKIEDLGKKL
jgi:hypothetical protein